MSLSPEDRSLGGLLNQGESSRLGGSNELLSSAGSSSAFIFFKILSINFLRCFWRRGLHALAEQFDFFG
jgi:hypothetical protein